MGRWVTSKGRRIYIPDEGEENPFAKITIEGSRFGKETNDKISDYQEKFLKKTYI